ncbi:hypothetical protein [Listeria monocytogenes]|uniref:hypothetical protein n=1 Tax=Listeria monocytogenes TaxID=1639 RepID=UPI001F157B59|nr:hypothetical protein [Listeria monocytogenes]
MAKGAFQTSREIFENPIWSDVVKFRIFFYIYGNAVFANEGSDVAGIHLKRGQFLRSFRNLQNDLAYKEKRGYKQYSLNTIKNKIDQLVKEKRIEIESTDYGTLFTVLNYEEYQGFERYSNTLSERQENDKRTLRERQENNNKNVKNDKNVKNINNKTLSSQPRKKRVYDFDSNYYQLAERLFKQICQNQEIKEPNLQSWADDIRKMIEIDKRTEDQVGRMIDWSQADNFWSANILSARKLREKYDTMAAQANRQYKQSKNRQETCVKQTQKSNLGMSF